MSEPLRPLAGTSFTGVPGPVVVAVMDGVGLGAGDEGDAVARAKTPNLDRLQRLPLATTLTAHGTAVGMPGDGDMGNSEVGHNALGSGRIVAQGAKLVAEALGSGAVFKGEGWQELTSHLQQGGGTLHLLGLLSDGNVHSHIDHIVGLLQQAAAQGVVRARLHVLLDGRDVPPRSAMVYVQQLESVLANLNRDSGRDYRIASGGGRMVTTMDRYESDWGIVERGWNAHVHGEAEHRFGSTERAVEGFRSSLPDLDDQRLPAFVICDDQGPIGTMRDGDAVVAFNFRGDRMLQICRAFVDDDFPHFDRGQAPDVLFMGMTEYDGDLHLPPKFLVAPPVISQPMGELLCQAGVGQLACSETQKFGHVTYFWNGNRSGYIDSKLECYIEVPSNPPPFDAEPAMKAVEITDAVLQALGTGKFRCARLNYANGDMVGHTGNFPATVRAVEVVDAEIGRLAEAVVRANGALIVTADHGNADEMFQRKGGVTVRDASGLPMPKTSHSLSPVPFCVALPEAYGRHLRLRHFDRRTLGHVAGAVFTLLGFQTPSGYLPGLVEPT